MNKIMIVGHPTSKYQDVEALLSECGMAEALPSRREGLTPNQISAMLLKAHSATAQTTAKVSSGLVQVDAGPIWHGMALDLMLGNLDQKLWGWADPHAVQLLDYWKSLDRNIAFILVYESPESLVVRLEDPALDLTPDHLQHHVKNWCNYNAALLHFFYRNTDRCLLVHAQQVRLSASKYLQQVRTRIGAPLEPPPNLEADGLNGDNPVVARRDSSDVGREGVIVREAIGVDLPASPLKAYLASAIIESFSEAMQLYDELQASANLPLGDECKGEASVYGAWRVMEETASRALALEAELEATRGELAKSVAERQLGREEIETLLVNVDLAAERLAELDVLGRQLAAQTTLALEKEKELLLAEKQLARKLGVDQENELLIAQLHQVQEELERRQSVISEQSKRIESLEGCERVAAERLEHLEGARERLAEREQEIERKTTQLRDAETRFKKRDGLEQENALLLAQLHEVQEKLERSYLENHAMRSAAEARKQTPEYYGAAQRIKRQLSYRLGAAMIASSRSFAGWAGMPWALIREIRQFRAELNQRSEEKLPPIFKYRDAHEAERVRRHLSYRLGATLIANSKSPIDWLRLPFALRGEIKAFRLNRASQQ